MKTNRRRSREFALQGLYQWQLTHASPEQIESQLHEDADFGKIDDKYFVDLLHQVINEAPRLERELQVFLDRPIKELSPVERSVLLMAAYELSNRPEIPYRVVINEAVELAKSYGGTDGHKYVNGVLDKLATKIRAIEPAVDGTDLR